MEFKHLPGHTAVVAASERLDHAGMQARLQLGAKDVLMPLIIKEVTLGLNSRELALGMAGFVTTIIATMVARFVEPKDRARYAAGIGQAVVEMLEDTDWKEEGK